MSDPIDIEHIGGNCPVQAEGTICGVEFYFRARGAKWSLSVGGEDIILKPDWYYEETFGTWPEAGWMDRSQAEGFIRQAAAKYIREIHPERVVDLPAEVCDPSDQGPVEPSLPGHQA